MKEELPDLVESIHKVLLNVPTMNPKNFYVVFEGFATGGILDIPNRDGLRAALRILSDNTKVKLELSIWDEKKELDKRRTEQQNKYYHKILDIICEYNGDTHMDMHTELKAKFLARPWVKGDKEYLIVKSTKELTSKQFSSYIEQVFMFASTELGLILPNSSEYY